MRACSWVLVLCSSVIVASCQAKPLEAPAPVPPPYTTTATVKDIMLHVIDPAGDMVWDSVGTIIDKGGIHETAPKTDEEWHKVRNGLITLIEASNLLMIPGRAMARPGEKSEAPGVELEPTEMEELVKKDLAGWHQRARALHDISVEVLKVVDAKDAQKLFDMGEDIDKACENCHRQYWYPNEQIPDFPGAAPASPPASK